MVYGHDFGAEWPAILWRGGLRTCTSQEIGSEGKRNSSPLSRTTRRDPHHISRPLLSPSYASLLGEGAGWMSGGVAQLKDEVTAALAARE